MNQKLTNAFGKVYLTIEIDKDNQWVHVIWEGYLTEANVKAGALALTDAVVASGLNCVLNDMQLVFGPIRSTEWAATEWAPVVAKAGLKYMAIVNAPDAIAATDVDNFHNRQTYFDSAVFTHMGEGKKWLKQHCQKSITRLKAAV
ncbi:STAS/SEC14 domain-containing protein [Pontibacter ruber]|uniref:STAS/SEC14 domain-containing protein n=1 Tax=Pontibacter ruber TaxID=1343895 RepID=A0ABW5CSQ4_9BACT|nr:STAS/SEC14 domain-containing protein [Pontibacter ruber]